ncbi:hypothetical protein M495_03370 [Serratia liquefaciens ATCC 27592]|nr:hypothetical protein M495_03370 [Serratia liquefaciens ATCC 27592]
MDTADRARADDRQPLRTRNRLVRIRHKSVKKAGKAVSVGAPIVGAVEGW